MIQNRQEMDERQHKALTGLTHPAFDALLPTFRESYQEIILENYAKNQAKRKRRPGGGQKGRLNSLEKKLFFILYYLKVYPTFDVLGANFGMDRSKAWMNVNKLFPVLNRALAKVDMLPKRHFESAAEMRQAFAQIVELLVDATERPQQRPQDEVTQKQKYSGKRKRHTAKNTVIANLGQKILFLGYTVFGQQHDYALFKNEFSPQQNWFETFKVWLDLGYLGFQKEYQTLEIHLPHKKPRKSKAHPQTALTLEQKEENRQMSRVRVLVENAICRMKRFRCLVDTFRNHKENLVDDVAVLAAGLANWSLSSRTVPS